MVSDGLAATVRALPSGWHGRYYDAVESTQDVARAAARAGAPERSIFVADYQRAGRGRQGRTWLSKPGSGLLMSVVFRDSEPRPWRWTSLTSLALADAIEPMLPGHRVAIKWPNDVMLNDRKVAGVLAENLWNGQRLVAVVGVGVNVNVSEPELPQLPSPATSLCVAAGRCVDRGALLRALIGRVDHWLAQPLADAFEHWEARLWGRGQPLSLLDLGERLDVIVLGAAADGALRVRLPDGAERITTTGELIV